ncbi:Leucine-rich repeat domain superfamily protein [Abortiporus biennis]
MSSVFSLQGRGLKLDTRADIAPYLEGVDPSKIEEIHFGGNTIGVEAAEALAEFLQKATSIKVADFADIFTGRLISEIPQALSSICDALIDKTSLVEINLSDNAFGGRSVDPMVPFLIGNRSFQILRLNNNGLGPAGGTVIAEALLQSALLSKKEGKKSNLRTVICGRNRLEDGSAPVWGQAFEAHGGLEEIRMPQNGIRMSGISNLVQGISHCASLHTLDLEDNTFGDVGSNALVKVLESKFWKQLENLILSDCHLTDEGDVSEVVKTLSEVENLKLKRLHLQNNNLQESSFSLLAEGIHKNLPALKRLEIQWNDVDEDDESIQSLIGTLTKRGGKVIIDDEDEEEEEEEEEAAEAEVEAEQAETATEVEQPPAQSVADKAADALADALSKVTI